MPGFELYDESERNAVNEVFDAGVLFRYGYGPTGDHQSKARTFEAELCQTINAKNCHLCSSGTGALSIALAACGIGAGDEVIVPPFTFIATIEAVLNAGAIPVFSEIDETLCLDPDGLSAAVTRRTRAVLPVHMCGAMAQIDKLKDFCDDNNLILIEDACQALGGTFNGRHLGTFGHMGCFSFDPVKTITCGEGGAVVTNDDERHATAESFADHGHDHKGADRGADQHPMLGMNYRISELNAAVGLAQLRKLGRMLTTQRANKKRLKDALKDIPGISFRRLPDEAGDSATFLSFFLPDENQARQTAKDLTEAGVAPCFYWFDNNWHYLRQWEHLKKQQTAARLASFLAENARDYSRTALPQSDHIMSRCISLLIKLSWRDEELSSLAKKMKTVLSR